MIGSTIKRYTSKEIADSLGISKDTVTRTIRFKLGQKPIGKKGNNFLYSEETFSDVLMFYKRHTFSEGKYIPFRIETIYHIYESKMNYLTNL